MNAEFYQGNRQRLYDSLPDHTLLLLFSGSSIRKTADENYPFYADRSFLYLTGIGQEHTVLMAEKDGEEVQETLYILPPDMLAERWTGKRFTPEEARARSGAAQIASSGEWENRLKLLMRSGRFERIAMDLYRHDPEDEDTESIRMARRLRKWYPAATLTDISRQIRRQRTIKQPCEIEAMREAVKITRDGILAMMKASKPGMYEYQYKAEYDYALAQHGVLEAGFPSIISAGKNNFCIHYYGYRGQAMDGDIVLNDVGVRWDNELTDVSRGWPCNGKYSSRQKLLFECQYKTSEHMFSTLKPGVPMMEVDAEIRRYCFEQLKEAGVCKSFDDIGTYMWHGGAHHVGFDTHDVVSARDELLRPGMTFCVDIGIYHEEWGIGFRLEDNCLITEDGCRNLSKDIPRTVEDIEAVMN